jgi:CubicO group peptidase (beta-lactamase class C family)
MPRPRTILAQVLGSLTLVLFASAAWAQGLQPITPEQAGFVPARLGRIADTLRAEIEKGKMPGAVVLIARRGQVAYFEAFGKRDPADGGPMPKDAIFRMYSMTKPMTSVAVMMLVEEGKIVLSDPASKFLPQLGKLQVTVERLDPATGKIMSHTVPAEREITIQDLLRHTSGFTYGARTTKTSVREAYRAGGVDVTDLTNAELIDRIAKAPLVNQPGTAFEYGRSTDVLGRVVEVVSRTPLGRFFEQRITQPLKMTDTGFFVPTDKHARIAQPFPKDVVTGQDVRLLDVTTPPKYEAGGQGGVTTAMDYARFSQMLLNRGSLDGARILSRHTVELMTSDHLGKMRDTFSGPGYGFGLGFAVRVEPGLATSPGSVGDYNWAGAGGTYFWVDPKEQLVAVLMAQTPGAIRTYYRVLFRDLVYQALVD